MSDFPSIELPSNISEKLVSFKKSQKSSAGYSMIANAGAVMKKQFTLDWEQMTSVDKATLISHFQSNYVSSFSWTHFETSTVYTVFYENEDLDFQYFAPGYWSVSLILREL
jgi:hypothetical protein